MEADAGLVDPDLNLYRRTELWLSLRLLNGLDLQDFLNGCRQAYVFTSVAMYSRDWDALASVVETPCLEAMQATVDHFASAGQRIQLPEPESDAFRVISCKLRKAEVFKPAPGVAEGSCHLHVRFRVDESFTIFDFHSNEPLEPFDGRVTTQESTWVFSGVVTPPDEPSAGDAETQWWLHTIF